ncbi:FliM/FliN family flagellar motor switch protein [Hasllibacter sp. MH4015]|uniref:FliM/FliN family flagellar motor switch protein n=1 Tax=Hasllibacter sp. MH4015 TaxID=2854029 RepID=UPI001CD807B4|nr:FliM/FliN family flagellar motor switch protein [Hasllibacter sp. MH4015]
MPETKAPSVLARIVAAHSGVGHGRADPSADLQTALTRAVRRAAIPFEGLQAQPGEVSVDVDAGLSAAVEHLPETGLLAACEDAEGRRGLVALSHGLVDALIEVQTTGKVEEADHPARPVTRIDEVLSRDFIDLLLAAFARETRDVAGRDWPERIAYGSRIADPAQLNLLLPERAYHRLSMDLAMGKGRKGKLFLLLPADPAIARAGTPQHSSARAAKPRDWGDRMLDILRPAPLVMDAILMRTTLPLKQVDGMAVGDLIPFDASDLAAVSLEGPGGHVFVTGALGQWGGRRAVRPVVKQPRKVEAKIPAPQSLAAPDLAAHEGLPSDISGLAGAAEAHLPATRIDAPDNGLPEMLGPGVAADGAALPAAQG